MLVADIYPISVTLALTLVTAILTISVVASIVRPVKKE
jgi:hypothetical protein